MNKVILMGRLTKDPEIRYTQNEKIVVNFTLAVNRRFTKENEQKADFFNIVAWGKTAEFVGKYFRKGLQVGLIGRLQTRNYEDNQGQKKYITEVFTEEAYFADSNKENKVENSAPNINFEDFTPNFNIFEEDDDDLPF